MAEKSAASLSNMRSMPMDASVSFRSKWLPKENFGTFQVTSPVLHFPSSGTKISLKISGFSNRTSTSVPSSGRTKSTSQLLFVKRPETVYPSPRTKLPMGSVRFIKGTETSPPFSR